MHEEVFFSLVRAGLWEGDVKVNGCGLAVSGSDVMRLAEEQSVVGLVTAGFERLTAYSLPLTDKLTLLGKCQLIEQRNAAMNQFVAGLMAQMREVGIKALLLKGQGLAQCYERPMWRTCGDVDLCLDDDNYERAKRFLQPLASRVDKEAPYSRHLAMTIDPWTVELHGYLRCGLFKRIDRELDEMRRDEFEGGKERTWMNGNTQVYLPSADCDAVYVFVHFLNHFYKGGICLRQVCDWCRLLWTYREALDVPQLERHLNRMGLLDEWKGFAALAVEKLGMPVDAMPLYDAADKWKRKAVRILDFMLESGNKVNDYYRKPYVIRKFCSMRKRLADLFHHACIFPLGAMRFLPNIMFHGLRSAARGE